MNILLISKLFYPDRVIGAVRPYNFAKYLSLTNRVTCVTGNKGNTEMEYSQENGFKVVRIPSGKLGISRNGYEIKQVEDRCQENKEAVRKCKIIKWIRRIVAHMWNIAVEIEWYWKARKICEDLVIEEQVDVIISSYGPVSNLLCGLYLKRKYRNIKWISDMRDPVDSVWHPVYWRFAGGHLQRRMLHRADVILTVCDGLSERYQKMCKGVKKNKIYTVVNGYEEAPITFLPQQDGVLRIGYTGQLYDGMRDMSILFQCIVELEKEQGTSLPLEIHYAGSDAEILKRQAMVFGCEKYLFDHGLLSKEESNFLQERCDVLCVLSWNTKKEKGVLTGKFPEYLRLRKPILAIVSGECANSELSQRIEGLRIGFTYEAANHSSDFLKLQNWINKVLEEKKNGQNLLKDIEIEKVEEYAYPRLIAKVEHVLKNT